MGDASALPQVRPVASYNTKGSRLTCVFLADGKKGEIGGEKKPLKSEGGEAEAEDGVKVDDEESEEEDDDEEDGEDMYDQGSDGEEDDEGVDGVDVEFEDEEEEEMEEEGEEV
jgi:hypothetical protein